MALIDKFQFDDENALLWTSYCVNGKGCRVAWEIGLLWSANAGNRVLVVAEVLDLFGRGIFCEPIIKQYVSQVYICTSLVDESAV